VIPRIASDAQIIPVVQGADSAVHQRGWTATATTSEVT
jgi:hypothetical protein